MAKPAWSWSDYERCKRAEERRAKASAVQPPQGRPAARSDAAKGRVSEDIAPAEAGAEMKDVQAQEIPTADDASGCEGRAAEVVSGPAPVEVTASPHVAVKARQSRVISKCPAPERIRIDDAPSAMEASAERWRGASPFRLTPGPIPASARNRVMCRCGGGDGKRAGLVPSWFGDKCIEGDCPLRGMAKRKVAT